jgi:hypothetical protein
VPAGRGLRISFRALIGASGEGLFATIWEAGRSSGNT